MSSLIKIVPIPVESKYFPFGLKSIPETLLLCDFNIEASNLWVGVLVSFCGNTSFELNCVSLLFLFESKTFTWFST